MKIPLYQLKYYINTDLKVTSNMQLIYTMGMYNGTEGKYPLRDITSVYDNEYKPILYSLYELIGNKLGNRIINSNMDVENLFNDIKIGIMPIKDFNYLVDRRKISNKCKIIKNKSL